MVQLCTTSTPSISRKMKVTVKGCAGGSGGCIQKTIKKCHEFNKISTLTSNKNSLKKAMKLGFFSLSYLTIWLYCLQGLGMGGGGEPPIRGRTPRPFQICAHRIWFFVLKIKLFPSHSFLWINLIPLNSILILIC